MYSLLDGYSTPEEYLKKAGEIGLKAFAITEHGNEYSWCYFDKIKKNYPNIKIIYGCCIPGQPIYKHSGIKNIEEIKIGEKVLTHNGGFELVTGTMSREYNGKLYGFTAPRCNTVWLTGEHPVYIGELNSDGTFTRRWVKAENLKSSKKKSYMRRVNNWNTYVCFPKQQIEEVYQINLIDYLDKKEYSVTSDGYLHKNAIKNMTENIKQKLKTLNY